MNEIAMTSASSRFDRIIALVDAWADEHAGWDCRDEAVAEVEFILGEKEYSDWDDEMVADAGIAAWEMAE